MDALQAEVARYEETAAEGHAESPATSSTGRGAVADAAAAVRPELGRLGARTGLGSAHRA